MDLTNIKITYKYLSEYYLLSWCEISFGYSEHIIDSACVINLASDYLINVNEDDEDALELSISDINDNVKTQIDTLVSNEKKQDEEYIKNKWLYIALHWLFKNKDSFGNPLDKIEDIYAEFDYPDSISMLIRYMPSDEPDLGSRELNENRLYEKWKTYLEKYSGYLKANEFK